MISILPNREAALQIVAAALTDRFPPSAVPRLMAAFQPFEARAIYEGPLPIGAILVRGPEVHVAIIKPYRGRWLSKRIIREVLGGLLQQRGYALTSVMRDNPTGQDFVQRLGFRKVAENDLMIGYRLEKREMP